MTDTLTIRAALAELVACKDMQAEIQGLIRQPSDGGKGDKRYAFLDAEYKRRMPLAWEAARLSLTAGSAEPEPTEQQIIDAAEKAGLWPNTVRHWMPAFHRYHAILAEQSRSASPPATERGYLGSTVDGGIDDHDTEQSEADAFMAQAPEVRQRMWGAATVMPAAQPEPLQALLIISAGYELVEGMKLAGDDEKARGRAADAFGYAVHAALRPTAPQPSELYFVLADALAGWRYIRSVHGDLSGVGWDRVEQRLTACVAALRPSPTSSAPAEPLAILARMVELAPFTSFLGAYVNEWNDLIGRAALAFSVPPEQQREHKGLS